MPAAKEHLYEVDLLRACIIFGVLCVHGISFYNLFVEPFSNTNIGYEAGLVAFHFTREAFMFITGLVLFITYYNRPFRATSFWSKRFKLIFIPYAAWTLIYILFSGTYLNHFDWSFSGVIHSVVQSLLTGQQFYLYYLLISMQLYLVFPWMVMLLKRLEKWHGWVFVVSFVLEVLLMWWNRGALQHMHVQQPGWLVSLWKYRDRNLITYQFWFVSGAIVAIHYQRIKAWMLSHTRLIVGGLVVGLMALWVHFAIDRLVFHHDETTAVLVLQPIMVPYSFLVTIALLRLGMSWSRARSKPRMQAVSKFIKVAASASFGVFLAHPLVLHFVEVFVYRTHPGLGWRIALTPISILVVYLVAILVSRVIGQIPWISYIVGQKKATAKVKVGSGVSQAT